MEFEGLLLCSEDPVTRFCTESDERNFGLYESWKSLDQKLSTSQKYPAPMELVTYGARVSENKGTSLKYMQGEKTEGTTKMI
jgi:hypothetical protein